MIKILYFASMRDLTGKAGENIERMEWSVRELLQWAEETYPNFDKHSVLVAINEEYVTEDEKISDGDVVVFIPPVSGG